MALNELITVNEQAAANEGQNQPWHKNFRTSSPFARSSFVLGVVSIVFAVVPIFTIGVTIYYLK